MVHLRAHSESSLATAMDVHDDARDEGRLTIPESVEHVDSRSALKDKLGAHSRTILHGWE